MTIIAFILATVFMVGIISTIIRNGLTDIKTLEYGTTLDKMKLLGVGVNQTLFKNDFNKIIRRKKYDYLASIIIAILLVVGVIALSIMRLIFIYI